MPDQAPQKRRFDVDVCRTGVGFATISVMARTAAEADELALDCAGDYEYSEKNSEYSLVHPSAPEERAQGPQRTMELVLELTHADTYALGPSTRLKGLVMEVTADTIRRWREVAGLCAAHGLSEARQLLPAVELLSWRGEFDEGNASVAIEGGEICSTATDLWVEATDRHNSVDVVSSVVDLADICRHFDAGCERLVVAEEPLELVECFDDQRTSLWAPSATTALFKVGGELVPLEEYQRYFGFEPVDAPDARERQS